MIVALGLQIMGCATNYDNVKEQAVSWLEKNKDSVREALKIAGRKAMEYGVSPDERKEIANQMWAASTAFNSLATGKDVTAEQVRQTLIQFSAGTKSIQYKNFISEATVTWSFIYKNLNLSAKQNLVVDYLIIFSEVAQDVASSYTELTPTLEQIK